jgi:integrase
MFNLTDEQFPWSALRYTHVVVIRQRLVAQDQAPNPINLTLAALRGVAREAWNLEYLTAEEYQRIKSVKGVSGSRLPAGRSFSSGELSALLRVCTDDPRPGGVRDAAILAILYSAGLRRDELAGLEVADWVPDDNMLKVRHGKGNKQRHVYLSEGAIAALDDWLALRGPHPSRLFLSIDRGRRIYGDKLSASAVRDIVVKRASQAHVTDLSPHDFRRTVAGDLLDNDVDIVTVQKLLGHASVQTTASYDRRGERAKKKAVGTLHVPYRRRT